MKCVSNVFDAKKHKKEEIFNIQYCANNLVYFFLIGLLSFLKRKYKLKTIDGRITGFKVIIWK